MSNFSSAGSSQSLFSPDDLIAGDPDDILTEKVTMLSGQNLTRGAVLGKVRIGAAVGAAAAGNTGNGALAGVAVGSAGAAKVGVYRVLCVEAAANSGRFVVEDPDGIVIGQYVVAAPAFNNQVTFTIADGATDFLAGDSFTITIAEGSDKFLLSAAAAIDGSQAAIRILAQDCNASLGDAEALVFRKGTFNDSMLTLGAGQSVALISDSLRLQGIFLTHGQPSL